jgi:hypothetical protein
MPRPLNESQSLERELAELSEDIAAYQRELDATPIENRGRREMREWQLRRLANVQARLAHVLNRALSRAVFTTAAQEGRRR